MNFNKDALMFVPFLISIFMWYILYNYCPIVFYVSAIVCVVLLVLGYIYNENKKNYCAG